MLDFLLRRNNPTNHWQRRSSLGLMIDLSAASINDVSLGQPFEMLSFLGRDEDGAVAKVNVFRYYSLGLEIERDEQGRIRNFFLIFNDEEDKLFKPFVGEVKWQGKRVDFSQLKLSDLSALFGEWYWFDADEDYPVAFYEFPPNEWHLEGTPEGRINRILLHREPSMADPEQRKLFKVDKSWPPS